MAENIIIDNYEFEKISDGFYKALTPYAIDKKEWMNSPDHEGMSVLGSVIDGEYVVEHVSTNSRGNSTLTDMLNKDYNGKFCFEASPKSDMLLGVYEDVN